MRSLFSRSLLTLTLALVGAAAPGSNARAAQWSDNAIRYWYSPAFTEPGIVDNVPKNVLSFTHVSGYSLGGNFLNADLLYSKPNDPVHGDNVVPSAGALELYLVYRSSLSLNKITGTKTFEAGGVLRDVQIDFGADLGTKNNGFASRKIMPVAGVSASLAVPGFLDVGVLLDKEWNVNAIVGKEVTFNLVPMFVASWGIPVAGPLSFEGFIDINMPKGKDAFGGDTKTEVLLHPKAMVDLGYFFGTKGYQVGAGWEYWLNKFGSDHDTTPGCDQSAAFVEVALHL